MKRNNFFAKAASKALALAAVVMMSAAFTACSSSNDEPTPPPSSKAGTVTLDGVEKPILKAEYDDNGNGNYSLYLNLSADGKEKVKIELNKDQHITGSPIDLTEKEKQHGDNWCWVVEYYKPDDTKLIDTFGAPDAKGGLYTTGTLTISGSLDGTINIRLKNGRVNGTDGKEHTFVLNYSGTMTKSEDDPTPEPKAQTVTLDGAEKPILEAGYQYWGDGNYVLFFSLSASSQERVRLELNKELHVTGNPINLTEKEKNRTRYDDRFRWGVTYLNAHGNLLFYANGTEPVFETGTLTMSGSPDGTINIRLENGRVKGEDGKEYTFTLSYSGTMERAGGPTPVEKYVDLGLSVKWARCNLGASKPTDYGDYFAWGETEPNKADYTWATYKWMQAGKDDWKHITKYTAADGHTEGIWYDADGNFIGDNKTTLEAADDAAIANLGSPWRMPTGDEIQELLDNCTWRWTTQDGVNGCEVKSKKNGNTIFLPAAGYYFGSDLNEAGSWGGYWSSSLYTGNSEGARSLYFKSGEHNWDNSYRYCGFSVRPVRP